MKKFDFKKLALMGITGGVMMAGQASAGNEEAVSTNENLMNLLAGNGCGGNHGCHGSGGNAGSGDRGYTTFRNTNQSMQQPGNPSSYNPSHSTQNYNPTNTNPSYNPSSMNPSNNPSSMNPSYHPSNSNQNYNPTNSQQNQNPSNINQNRGMQNPTSYNMQPNSQWNNNHDYSDPAQMNNPSPHYYMNNNNNNNQPQGKGTGSNQNYQSGYQHYNGPRHGCNSTADANKGTNSMTQKQPLRQISESELRAQLNDQGKSQFNSLDAEGKALALRLANQSCKGENECKGLNSCKGNGHDCAGKGSCKGTSPGPITDKNVAVKLAAAKMAEKRAKMNSR